MQELLFKKIPLGYFSQYGKKNNHFLHPISCEVGKETWYNNKKWKNDQT